MNNLMTLWAEGFKKQYPNVSIQIEGKGSSTAPPALIAGHRAARPDEPRDEGRGDRRVREEVRLQADRDPRRIDALAVYVNKDNPIKCLTMQQVDAIFSQGRACGGKPIANLGPARPDRATGPSKPISLYGRNSASGTYGYFKEHALCKGDFKDTVKEQPGSASVVQGVTEDKFGIGYSGIGYKTSDVRAVPLSAKPGGALRRRQRGERATRASTRWRASSTSTSTRPPTSPSTRWSGSS